METTTDLKIIRKNPKQHTWGPVLQIIDIEQYTLVFYHERLPNSTDLTDTYSWAVYVDGVSTKSGAKSLEGALLVAIAYGGKLKNPDAAVRYAAKLLELEEDYI